MSFARNPMDGWKDGCGHVKCVRRNDDRRARLTSKTVESATLPLESVNDVHGRDRFPLRVLGVGDGVANDVFQEHLEDASGFFVDETGDTFHTSSAGQTSDCGFRDALDVVAQNFAMTLGTSFSQPFASFTATCHL